MTTTSQAEITTNTNAFAVNGGAGAGDGGGSGAGLANNGNLKGSGGGGRSNAMGSLYNTGTPAAAATTTMNVANKNKFSNNYNAGGVADTAAAGVHSQRAVDSGKQRKKIKSRNFTLPNTGYTKDHLDAWLETCLKDASNAQLSSSSEFLDYNPTPIPTAALTTTAAAAQANMLPNKHILQQHQQQQPQQMTSQQAQQQQLAQQIATSSSHNVSSSSSNLHNSSQQAHNHSYTHQPSQQFALRMQSQQPPYATGYGTGTGTGPVPFSQGLQRGMPNFVKHSNSINNRYSLMFPPGSNYFQQNDGQDFASLPPIVNMMGGGIGGGSSELENNSTELLDGSGSNPNISRGFRFSDPCLLNPSDNDSKMSGQNTPDRRNNAPSDGVENQKFFSALMEQINLLHETNSKICRNLHETKVDIEALKHAPTWGMRHRRDSLSGLSTHSQPMVFGGGFGTQSPAPTYHSGAYTPGMMTDVVREVKEAARVREDALLNRVKAMVEERQWSMNESNMRMMRDIEDLKSQIHHLRADRKETNKRINHLEAENKYMRQMIANIFSNRNVSDIIYENEALRTRKSFPHATRARRSQSLNLNYGTIHHQPVTSSLSVDEQEEALHIIETPSTNSTADMGSLTKQRTSSADMRHSFSSSDGGGGGCGGVSVGVSAGEDVSNIHPVLNGNANKDSKSGVILSPPSFALITPPESKGQKELSSKQQQQQQQQQQPQQQQQQQHASPTKELQRELHEAVAARKEADQRIIALEKLVNNLRLNTRNQPSAESCITNGAGCSIGDGVINTTRSRNDAATNSNIPSTQTHMWHISPTPTPMPMPTPKCTDNSTEYANHKQHQAHTTVSTSVNMTHSLPKLSVAGPITDL